MVSVQKPTIVVPPLFTNHTLADLLIVFLQFGRTFKFLFTVLETKPQAADAGKQPHGIIGNATPRQNHANYGVKPGDADMGQDVEHLKNKERR